MSSEAGDGHGYGSLLPRDEANLELLAPTSTRPIGRTRCPRAATTWWSSARAPRGS